MKTLRVLLWGMFVVWFGNLLVVSNWQARRMLLGSAVLAGSLVALSEWAARHPNRVLARRLMAPAGPELVPHGGRTERLRAAGWFLAWATILGLAAAAVLSVLVSSTNATLQTAAIWLFPFTGFGAALALSGGILLLVHGLRTR